MSKMNKLLKGFVGELRDSVQRQGLTGRTEIGKLALGTESMDAGMKATATAATGSLHDLIESAISQTVSTEDSGITVTAAQIASARGIAGLATDPANAMSAIGGNQQPGTVTGAVHVSAEDMGVMDSVDPATLSVEAFDEQSLNNALYFSIAYNLFAAKQDAFGEAFFPTITIDPTMSGISIGTDVTSLYTDFERNIDGGANRSKFAKVTLAKALYDNNIMGGDRNQVVPVSRVESASKLLTTLESVNTDTGESITTAPLLIGQDVNLLGISQTAAQLAKGTMDAYDSLDRTINLKSIVVSLTDPTANVGAGLTEYFRVPVGMLPHSNFTYTTQDHDKDLALAFSSNDITFLTSSTPTWNGSVSTILSGLTPAHTVKLRVKLNGDGNTQFADIAVYSSVAEVSEVLDAAGNALATTDAVYASVTAGFANMAIVGYELEAYLTNSNLRKQGQLITMDHFEQVYNVPVRSGISVVAPINAGSDGDARLIGQIQTAGFRMSYEAVATLTTFTDNLGLLTNAGANTNISLMGVGRHHVDPYSTDLVLDLAAIVDSESSSERGDDIRAAIVGRIRDEVYRAYSVSKFNTAHAMANGGDDADVGVIIGTSSRVKNYIADENGNLDLGSGFKAKVVSTSNTNIGDSMYITFSDHMASDRNTVVDALSFGQCIWAPTITTDVAVTAGGATTRRFQTHPRFLHIVNLPIMIRFNVTNIEAVLGKVARHTTAV